jgi:putative spermidine/putrescine transport system permease protein
VAAPGLARRDRPWLIALMLPVLVIFAAFFILPMARLAGVGAGGPRGLGAYAAIVTEPRYFRSLVSTLLLSAGVTVLTLAIATVAGVFLQRNSFRGRSVLIAMLTFPLAFPAWWSASW